MINVSLTKRKTSKNYYMRWTDPDSGRDVWQSTKTRIRRDAERKQRNTERELNEGTYYKIVKTTWNTFRDRYETEVVPGMADRTAAMISVTFNHVERAINPKTLKQIDANALSKFVKKMRERGLKEVSIKDYLAHLRSSLNWAESVGLINVVPKFPKLRRAKTEKMMKGRPLTLEEFERMLDAIPKVVTVKETTERLREKRKRIIESWKFYLEGLWCSGLRLSESLELYWDRDDRLSLDFSGKYPMMRIKADFEKGNKDRLLPIVPEFAEFLQKVPKEDRFGPVFNPLAQSIHRDRMTPLAVSEKVAAFGKKANVVVGEGKFASAHDLRRSFGERWSHDVMPQTLMQLMRHESMETTLKFYVGRNAEKVADMLYEAAETRERNNQRNSQENEQSAVDTIECKSLP